MPAGKGTWLCRCRASRLVPFAVALGLFIGGAGGATAVADPASHRSTEHGHSGAGASSRGGSSVGSGASNPAGSVAGTLGRTVQGVASTLGSGQNPGPHPSSGATTQIVLHGTDNKQEKQNAGLVAAPNVVASVPKPVAPMTSVPKPVAPAPNGVTSVPDAAPPIPNLATPVTNVGSVPSLLTPVTKAVAVSVPSPVAPGSDVIAALQADLTSTSDPDFISNTMNFGLFTITAAADPDDNEYVALVFSSSFTTDILTSGTDPSDSLGFGKTGIGIPGETVNTLETASSTTTLALPFTDPLAPLFTLLIPLGF